MQHAALSKQELNDVIGWFSQSAGVIPEPIRGHFERMIAVYSNMGHGKGRANQTLASVIG
jgi:hypothetical protein